MATHHDSLLRQAWADSFARLSRREQIRHAETEIYRRFEVFSAYKPLAYGIHTALEYALPHYDPKVLQRVVQLHCARLRYLKAIRQGGSRYDLHLHPSGEVTPSEQEDAQQRIAHADARASQDIAPAPSPLSHPHTLHAEHETDTPLPSPSTPEPERSFLTFQFAPETDTPSPTQTPPPNNTPPIPLPLPTPNPIQHRPTFFVHGRRLMPNTAPPTIDPILETANELRRIVTALGGIAPAGQPAQRTPLTLRYPQRYRPSRSHARRHTHHAAPNQLKSIKLPPTGVK